MPEIARTDAPKTVQDMATHAEAACFDVKFGHGEGEYLGRRVDKDAPDELVSLGPTRTYWIDFRHPETGEIGWANWVDRLKGKGYAFHSARVNGTKFTSVTLRAYFQERKAT